MTNDDLITLVEQITSGNDLNSVRYGSILLNGTDALSDDAYMTLVAFLAGKRPEGVQVFHRDGPAMVNNQSFSTRVGEHNRASRFAEPQAPGLTEEELAQEERAQRAEVAKFDMSGISLP